MKRRDFLGALAGLAPIGASAAGATESPPTRTVLVQSSPVAGFQYYEGERVWAALAVGDRLELVRQPDNRYDDKAVEILWKGKKLGYVPRAENFAVAQMLDRGERFQAILCAKREGLDPWQRLRVAISLKV